MSLENVIEFPRVGSVAAPQVGAALDTNHPKTGLKYGGFIPLRCFLFSPEFLRALSPPEVVVFLYLTFLAWRYPIKGGCVRAALPYLSEGTGISRTAVHRHLVRLESLGYIKCIEVNFRAGNVYRILDLLLWTDGKENEFPRVAPKAGEDSGPSHPTSLPVSVATVQPSQIETAAVSTWNGSSTQKGRQPSQFSTEDYSSLNSSKLSYSLSSEPTEPAKVTDLLERYLASIKPYKKREGEKKHFANLQKDFSLLEIAGALDYLQGYGLPGSGESCHSPMAYLSKAMNEVIGTLKTEAAKSQKARQDRYQVENQNRAERIQQEVEDREYKIKAQHFEKAFPSPEAQREYLRTVQQRFPMFDLDGPGLRSMAIQAWHSEGDGRPAR